MYQPKPLYKLLDWVDINKLHWDGLSRNPNAISLLEENLDELYDENCFRNLSENPNAISLLEKNPDIICWAWLSSNSNAIPLLEKNLNKLHEDCWESLSKNPSIFELDYKKMKKQMVEIYLEELMMVALHPTRISAWLDAGFEDF